MRNLQSHTFRLIALFIMACLSPAAVSAEVMAIEADAVYAIGKNIVGSDARRIAVLEALRNALDRAVASVSGIAAIRDLRITKEEMTAYAVGVLEAEIVREETRDAAVQPAVFVRIRARIDPVALESQIRQCSDDEELKEQLLASRRKSDRMKKDRDALLKRLAGTTDGHTIERSRRKLDQILSREESGNDILRIWSRYARAIDFSAPPKRSPSPVNGDLDKDIASLDRAVSVVPDNPRAHLLLAALHEMKGDDDMAEKRLRTAVKSNPTMPLFHMRLGLFLNLREKHEEALREFLAFERLKPRDPLVLFHIGATYKHLDQCRQAVVNLRRFLDTARKRSSPGFTAMKQDADVIIRSCEGKPRGPGSRQRPIRKSR